MADPIVDPVETETELPDTPPTSPPPAAPAPDPAPDPAPTDPPPAPSPVDEAKEMRERIEGMSKALQKQTQILASLSKKSAQQDGELTRVQEAQRQEAADQIAQLKKDLETYAADPNAGDGLDVKLSRLLIAQAAEVETLKSEVKTLRQRNPQPAQPSADQQWATLQATYPGADVKAIWKDAVKSADDSPSVKDAEQRMQNGDITPDAFQQVRAAVANDLFHHEARRAKPARPPTARPTPPSPPGGRRSVPFGGGSPAPTDPGTPDEQAYLQLVRDASKEMDDG